MNTSTNASTETPEARFLSAQTNDLAPTLRTIRSHIVESGEPLLDWDELEQAIAERRGER